MRKIMKKRHLHLPQIAAALLLAASVIFLSPDLGTCSTETPPKTHSTLSDGTVITTVSEKPLTENVVATENKTAVIYTAEKAAEAPKAKAEEKKAVPYHESIYAALKHQGLTEEHIGVWCEEHPLSKLNELKTLDPVKQKKIANAAAFIKKVNPQLSAKTAWREACAFIYYCSKYNVPADLAISIAKAESRFNPAAQSKSGALGTMQVVWKVHNQMLRSRGIAPTREHMFDPERGIEAGIFILSRYVSAYGSVQKALNRYYGGIGKSYLKKVNNNMAMYQKHLNSTGY